MVQNRFSKCDQTNVSAKVEEWQRQHPKDLFHFRPYAERNKESDIAVPEDCDNIKDDEYYEDEVKVSGTTCAQSLLFVHQTAWQRRLLQRYGNNICLLDATYRTTRYSLPLFFLAVKTNVDYQVVGSFIIQHETTEAIAEALQTLKQWNLSWKPQFFMTDLSEQEIIQHETPEAIAEALQTLKQWNLSWKPQFFMTDLSEQEINAVEEVFPGNF